MLTQLLLKQGFIMFTPYFKKTAPKIQFWIYERERGRVKNNYYLVKQQNYERTKDSVVFIWGLGKAL